MRAEQDFAGHGGSRSLCPDGSTDSVQLFNSMRNRFVDPLSDLDASRRSRSLQLHEDHRRRQARLKEWRERERQEREEDIARECTFRPQITTSRSPSTGSNQHRDGGQASDVFQRLFVERREERQPLDHELDGATFCPQINHNYDPQIEEWKQGVPACDRLFGHAKVLHQHRILLEEQRAAEDRDRTAKTKIKHPRQTINTVDKLYARAVSELNDEDELASNPTATNATRGTSVPRYLEDPREHIARKMKLREAYEVRPTFCPTINPCAPPTTYRASSSPARETIASRQRQVSAQRSASAERGGTILSDSRYRARRDHIIESSSRPEVKSSFLERQEIAAVRKRNRPQQKRAKPSPPIPEERAAHLQQPLLAHRVEIHERARREEQDSMRRQHQETMNRSSLSYFLAFSGKQAQAQGSRKG